MMSNNNSSFPRIAFVVFFAFLFSSASSLAQTKCPGIAPPTGLVARVDGMSAAAQKPAGSGGAAPNNVMQRMRPAAAQQVMAQVQVVCVPDFTGMTLDQAKAEIEKTKGLRFEGASPDVAGGRVTAQNPTPLRYVPVGTGVTLQLAAPVQTPNLRRVPDITHEQEADLSGYLQHAGLAYGGTTKIETLDYPAGSYFQHPLANTWVAVNTPVFRYEASAPPKPEPPQTYRLSVRANAGELSIGEMGIFVATLEPAAGGTTYQFEFGDHRQTEPAPENTGQHQYDKDGTFTVTVTARPPGQDAIQANVEVQVHRIVWTVVLEADPPRAESNTPIVFQAKLLPASPAPDKPEYYFYFDGEKKPELSNTPSIHRSFSDNRAHRVRVDVRDADHHIFRSDVVGFVIVPTVPSPWGKVAIIGAAILVCGIGGAAGFKVAQIVVTRGRIEVEPKRGLEGTQRLPEVPGGMVEAAFGFQVVHPETRTNAEWRGPVIKRVERLA